ncbi:MULTISPECIES: hypothetical protein [Serratia]|uniref:hypothetical protein n=1 Tax=Serratia TaxID=613 RepID=UPI000C1A2167|nr:MULTISPECIES: hypothetical protein [Serratia]PIJ42790.1 hypothetical protein BOM25_13420 [Serratia sp. OPWLW2]
MKDDIWIEEPVFRQMIGITLEEYLKAHDSTGELDGVPLPERKYRKGKGRLRLSEVEVFMKSWREVSARQRTEGGLPKATGSTSPEPPGPAE